MGDHPEIDIVDDLLAEAARVRESIGHVLPPDTELREERAAAEIQRLRGGWKPMEEAPEEPGTYINVRQVHSYRWLVYKPDGARQMKAKGRWQRASEYGWDNCAKPDGEFVLNLPIT